MLFTHIRKTEIRCRQAFRYGGVVDETEIGDRGCDHIVHLAARFLAFRQSEALKLRANKRVSRLHRFAAEREQPVATADDPCDLDEVSFRCVGVTHEGGNDAGNKNACSVRPILSLAVWFPYECRGELVAI